MRGGRIGFSGLLVGALLLTGLLAACDSEPSGREGAVRIATFNTHLARGEPGKLIAELELGSAQLDAIVKVIAANDPDILVIQELDFDPEGLSVELFKAALARGGVAYGFSFTAPVNTGLATGFDLDGDGKAFGPADAQGWGLFEGQFGMAVLSRYPIRKRAVRTFQKLRWLDMPDALMPQDFYPRDAMPLLRLSSKSHWDVPVELVDGKIINLLVSHPTPPVFDGPEDRNGRRNHDEIAFWSAYLDGAEWIVDDGGTRGGMAAGAVPIVAGDLNNDPFDGDGRSAAIRALLDHPLLRDILPRSERETDDGTGDRAGYRMGVNASQKGDPALDTADWRDEGQNASGDLRVDYLIPSRTLEVLGSGVFWPSRDDPMRATVEQASDHRLVWIDISL